jgi:endonuclease/exonuclease/phosphatase family metal-dependent hydrolase
MLTNPKRLALLVLIAFAHGMLLACVNERTGPTAEKSEESSQSYLFCFWNVENLFDDREDNRAGADKVYDEWFATDPVARQLKFDNVAKALITLNHGNGPDILAIAEVESVRAAELLRQALNARLPDKALHYEHLLIKEVAGGRHIAPAILTRLRVRGDKTRLHGRSQRILEGHIEANGHDLVVIASHWTSRVSDKEGRGRARYADAIYGVFKGMYRSNPRVDFLVCGDFNDTPDAVSVTAHLHATGDAEAVRSSTRDDPLLLNLMANKDPSQYGTHFYHKWFIFDQIAVSPGLLDNEGWSCDRDSIHTVNTLYRPGDKQKRPWHFGGPHDKFTRGYSDHFPVTLRLTVQRN